MTERIKDGLYQILHDVANNRIWLERQHPGSQGVLRRTDEGVRNSVPESYAKKVRRLQAEGMIEVQPKSLWAPIRLTLDGKLRWASAQG